MHSHVKKVIAVLKNQLY